MRRVFTNCTEGRWRSGESGPALAGSGRDRPQASHLLGHVSDAAQGDATP